MLLCCPVCKADNTAGPSCRRCKADLSMLFALEDQRTRLLMEVRHAFDDGCIDEALDLAHSANDLRQGDDSLRWLAILNLLTENFGEAWQAYQSTDQHG